MLLEHWHPSAGLSAAPHQQFGLLKNLNGVIFSGTVNVLNVKLYMVVQLIELYLFIPLTVTPTIFLPRSQQCQTVLAENFMFLPD